MVLKAKPGYAVGEKGAGERRSRLQGRDPWSRENCEKGVRLGGIATGIHPNHLNPFVKRGFQGGENQQTKGDGESSSVLGVGDDLNGPPGGKGSKLFLRRTGAKNREISPPNNREKIGDPLSHLGTIALLGRKKRGNFPRKSTLEKGRRKKEKGAASTRASCKELAY